MFQDFDAAADASETAPRIAQLRAAMSRNRLDALVIPHSDEHQSEYLPASAERLAWATGFTGSAGTAVIGLDKAALFTDGRYTVQSRNQTDPAIFELQQVPEQKVSDWLTSRLREGAAIGFDPWLHTLGWVEEMTRLLAAKSMRLKPTTRNLVDQAWGRDRPAPPSGRVQTQPLKYAGVSAADKLSRLQQRLKDDGHDAVVLTLADSICWLFNIRGSDVAHNPVVLAFAIVPVTGKPELFVAADKLTAEARAHLTPVARLGNPGQLVARLEELAARGRKIRLDPDTAAFRLARAIGKRSLVRGRDPVIEMKARKCPAEIRGARAAHVRDGAAMVRFLAWLDRNAASGEIDEITAVRELEGFRRASPLLRDISFDTISGSGPNGAIVHYRVTTSTNRLLRPGELFLVDSGAQYVDGTTDVTRTVAVGTPTPEMCQRYTAVLRGHIAVSTALFPAGTRGIELDAMARRPLWALGLDFDHGTGHGVGSYLSVHEGPASISKRGMVPIEPGMILSNEPGYYRPGAYGIRIENLVLVSEPALPGGGERRMMAFETLTLVPYDRRLIDVAALDPAERDFIDTYHARVAAEIGPSLEAADRAWLAATTKPLAR